MPRRRQARTRKRAPLPAELFFDEAAHRARSCESKSAYESEAHARAVMLANGTASSLTIYECRYCNLWHLTSRRDA
jgi:hypothetical protein